MANTINVTSVAGSPQERGTRSERQTRRLLALPDEWRYRHDEARTVRRAHDGCTFVVGRRLGRCTTLPAVSSREPGAAPVTESRRHAETRDPFTGAAACLFPLRMMVSGDSDGGGTIARLRCMGCGTLRSCEASPGKRASSRWSSSDPSQWRDGRSRLLGPAPRCASRKWGSGAAGEADDEPDCECQPDKAMRRRGMLCRNAGDAARAAV